MKGTYAIVTLGCKTNQFESTAMAEQLEQAGFERVDYTAGAELVIVNTCTVTAATDSQSRNLIRRARRLNPTCRVVVTGCYAQVDPAALENLPGVDLVLGNEEKGELLKWLSAEGPKVRVGDIRQASGVTFDLNSFGSRSRAFVQIQNGCNAFCSYCIIPHARGPSRSALPEQVLEQVSKFCAAGFPEIVLTGIHVGGYGNDLQPPSNLAALVRCLLASTEVRRLRIGSIEPLELSTELIELVAQSERLCPHFHIPLQAGDDGILKAMNRHYSVDYFRGLIQGIKARLPDAAIGLDVITGFPGETEQAFVNTMNLITELPVSHLHVFPFSRRPGTPAATMPQQVPGDVARQRAAQLRTLGEAKQRHYAQRFVGRRLDVVVEGKKRNGWRNGLSKHYLPVSFAAPAGLDMRSVSVEILESREEGLIGRLVD
jgi:threonylcarbamoyladenosine tRNA methylthiotransferase MtaB